MNSKNFVETRALLERLHQRHGNLCIQNHGDDFEKGALELKVAVIKGRGEDTHTPQHPRPHRPQVPTTSLITHRLFSVLQYGPDIFFFQTADESIESTSLLKQAPWMHMSTQQISSQGIY